MKNWLPAKPLAPLSKSEYRERAQDVRMRLLKLQHQLRGTQIPVLVVFGGVDGGGKHETVNLLSEWLDPRFLKILAYGEPSPEEAERPRMWRYWRDLPVRGRIGLVLSGWYSQPLVEFARHRSDRQRFEHQLGQIQRFEQMLCDDGALMLKFWMHLSAEQQHQRLKQLAEDPLTIWQVKPRDWEHLNLYDRFMMASRDLLERTHTELSPWQVIDGSQVKLRELCVAETLASALERRLASKQTPKARRIRPSQAGRLKKLDIKRQLPKGEYRERLNMAQARLIRLQQTAAHCGRSTLLVFEGWDAAGKGGAIRRIIRPLDARQYQLLPIAAPSDEELARHYLWRFWRHLPRAGRICIFDRSWYGRVLVERVEGFASKSEWSRAYEEINAFEEELTEHGIRLMKFWLHISSEEQLARFEARKSDPLKDWKLTDEDWRNRGKWALYEQAVEDMLARTDTPSAPWKVIPANDKRLARVEVIEAVCRLLTDG